MSVGKPGRTTNFLVSLSWLYGSLHILGNLRGLPCGFRQPSSGREPLIVCRETARHGCRDPVAAVELLKQRRVQGSERRAFDVP